MLKTTNQARNLSVVMDSDPNFNSQIKTITKSAYYHLKNISRIKGLMSQQDLGKLVLHLSSVDSTTAMVSSQVSLKIDQTAAADSDAAARVLTKTKKVDHISPVLRSLH